ncbi:MAG: NAD(P)H-dependent oxidoreductase subunit E [Planctomycetota bacterium]
MSGRLETTVTEICEANGRDRTRLLSIAKRVQEKFGCVSEEAIDAIADELGIPRVEIDALVSFYAFLSKEPLGKVVIRLSDDAVDRMHGYDEVREAFEEALGIGLGETTPDGKFTLERTACIGLSDQAPAALIGDVPVTHLDPDRAREIVAELSTHLDPTQLVRETGGGRNAHPLVWSMVANNLREEGEVLFSPNRPGEAIRKALAITPQEVIRAVKAARLRGRGGAGFPTGMKWEFTRAAPGDEKYLICNADEGEPGTFKDRVLLTEKPDRVFAGMTIGGYAIGASRGILYLRAEYKYLRRYLEYTLEDRRRRKLLGEDILHSGFDFDIEIRMGAGAYVCGEETALISSLEGSRGDPKTRPPFPAQKGYLGGPTSVNNVETLACVAKIIHQGAATFCQFGSEHSTGTKLLSVSGDCGMPGVYEVEFGITLREFLVKCGGGDAIAVQVGGPSGKMVGPSEYDRIICYEDLSTGGSMMVFGPERNVLEVARDFMEFFADESCGTCVPCRVGNVLLKEGLERILAGRGEPADLDHFAAIGTTMKQTSRCGLGQTSANPVLSTMEHFPEAYEALVAADPDGYRRSFDLDAELSQARAVRKGGNGHE